MKRFVSLFLAVVLLIAVMSPAFAGGPKYDWEIKSIAMAKTNGGTMEIIDQNGAQSLVEGDTSDIEGLMQYYGVKKPQQLVGEKFSGDDLGQTINELARWSSRMTPQDKLVEEIAKGLLNLKSFSLTGGTLSEQSDFVYCNNRYYLNKDFTQKLMDRVEVLSSGAATITAAKVEEFTSLPKAMCYDTFALKAKVMKEESISIGNLELKTNKSESTKLYRFTISANCTNAVQFDQESPRK